MLAAFGIFFLGLFFVTGFAQHLEAPNGTEQSLNEVIKPNPTRRSDHWLNVVHGNISSYEQTPTSFAAVGITGHTGFFKDKRTCRRAVRGTSEYGNGECFDIEGPPALLSNGH